MRVYSGTAILTIALVGACIHAAEVDTRQLSDTSTLSAEATSIPALNAPSRTRILLARPTTRYNTELLEDMWILRLCDAFLRFRLEGIPALDIVTSGETAKALPDYGPYARGIAEDEYVAATRSLGARYLVMVQVRHSRLVRDGELALGRETLLFGTIRDIASDSILADHMGEFPLKHLGANLDRFIGRALDALGVPADRRNPYFLSTAVLPASGKQIRKLGELLADPRAFRSEDLAWQTEAALNKLLSSDDLLTLGYFAAASFYDQAGDYEAAARFGYGLVNRLKTLYPPAYILTARNYRLAEKCDEALKVLSLAGQIEDIATEVEAEKSRCQ